MFEINKTFRGVSGVALGLFLFLFTASAVFAAPGLDFSLDIEPLGDS